jgi:hypothetical protein
VSFRRYLKENRGLFADHRIRPPGPGIPLDEDAVITDEVLGGPSARRRGRDRRIDPARGRFRHVKPAFAPSIWTEPLPYEEPLERIFR